MSKGNIYLYIPNLIGYFRAVCTAIMCYTARTDPTLTGWFYSIGMICDLFDGMAARHFKQSTVFGSVLDMVLDRYSGACLLAILYSVYPTIGFVFLLMLSLDLTSHWYQMYSTLYAGEKHHKSAVSDYRILEIYYKTPYVLLFMVFTSESAMVGLYILVWDGINPLFYNFVYYSMFLCVPCLLLKHFINVVQLMSSAEKIRKKECLELEKAKQ